MLLVIFISLTGMVSRIYKQTVLQAHGELAFQIAEDGLNYARWRFAHDDEDLSPETREVVDQFAGVLGSYDITFESQEGSTIVIITSTGRTEGQSVKEVVLKARYGIPSLAHYASLTNGDVWYGGEIKGVVHANGGIRMDGESDNLMTSARETYICRPHHECSNEVKPGVWGSGEREELWEFPVLAVDYNSLTLDLLEMKSLAQGTSTYYGPSGDFGYHLVFNLDNSYSIYRVTKKMLGVWSWFSETGWEKSSYDIDQQELIETKSVPSNGVIYTEDTLWISGEIRDRITVAAGKFPDTPSTNVDIIINGDITYSGIRDGSRIFGAIAQRHVLIPYSGAEDVLEIDGAYIAQKGRFGRRYYSSGAHRLKSRVERYGMAASNLVPVTAWVDGEGTVISGYETGESTYDPNLLYWPPPHFPTTGQYQFLSWEEVE
jgi:phosphoribosyl-AMP cyclohydrolase